MCVRPVLVSTGPGDGEWSPRVRREALVDVWVADATWDAFDGALPDDERAAAAAMRSVAARRRHLRARTLLRVVLGRHLSCPPSRVPLPPTGRPVVAGGDAPGAGVAHAGEVVVVAVRPDGPVGVDVEVLGSRRRPVPSVATDHGRSDVAGLLDVTGEDPALLAWVLQEAALKATGVGLAVALGDVRFRGVDGDVLVQAPDQVVCRVAARRRGDALVAVAVPGTDPITLRWHAPPTTPGAPAEGTS